jgi:hypothetical protein
MESDRYKSRYTQPFRWAIVISSILAVVFLIIRNHQKLKWQKNYFNRSKEAIFQIYDEVINDVKGFDAAGPRFV